MFDLKKNELGLVVRYKARLTLRGFEARAGLEYTDIFASVLRMSSLRLVLSLAAEPKIDGDTSTCYINTGSSATRQPVFHMGL